MRGNKSSFLLSALGIVKPLLKSEPETVLVHTWEQPPIRIGVGRPNSKHPVTETSNRWSLSDIFPNWSRSSFPVFIIPLFQAS